MKKALVVLSLMLLGVVTTFAQRNNIAPEIQARRDMEAIENKMVRENTDAEAVKLIKEHDAAKKRMDGTMRKLPGYGKAATDKQSLQKFREKNEKKDEKFAELSQKERDARKAKEDYISGVDDEYKKLRPIAID